LEYANTNPTILIVIIAIIERDQHRPGENFPSIGKVQTMLLDIGSVFVLVPLESHATNVPQRGNIVK